MRSGCIEDNQSGTGTDDDTTNANMDRRLAQDHHH